MQRRTLLWVLATALAWLVAGGVTWLRRPKSISDIAVDCNRAIWKPDGRAAIDCFFEEEVRANNLTPAKIEAILKEIVYPKYAGLDFPDKVIVQEFTSGAGASSTADSKNGMAFERSTIVYDTGLGEGKMLLTGIIQDAWSVAEMRATGTARVQPTTSKFALDYLRRDRARIEQLGLTKPHFMDFGKGQVNPGTWDGLENWYLEQIARYQQANRSPGSSERSR